MSRLALITGASSGIGRAIALALAKDGFDLHVVARSAEKLLHLAKDCAPYCDVTCSTCDLRDPDCVERLSDSIRGGTAVDAFVSSAGVILLNDIEAANVSEFDTMLATNFRAPLLLVRGLLPRFNDGGSMVFINSMAGLRTSEFNVLFSATKHALKAMCNGLRLHLASRTIRVLSVYPPLTATPTGEYVKAFYGSEYRPERLLQPHTIAANVRNWIVDPSDNRTEMLFAERPA